MEIINKNARKIMLIVLKDLSTTHTATSLSRTLKMSRWGIWKILKNLEEESVKLDPIDKGKTSTCRISINWNNVIVEKLLTLFLSQEAFKHKRWMFNFTELEKKVGFLILFGSVIHSPKQANDIDIIAIADKKNFVKIDGLITEIQVSQSKDIHLINLTKAEFREELKKGNKAYIDAVKKGVVLFGQENFVKFVREIGHG